MTKALTPLMYSTFICIIRVLPFKKSIYEFIKKNQWLRKKVYRDLKPKGKLTIPVIHSKSFKIIHYGGTIENEIYWFGLFKSWESEVGWLWVELVKKSSIIIDIGANTGVYSLVAKTINPKSNVYAFEPSLNTFEKLKKNNQLNGFDIKCENIALSNLNGMSIFYDTPDENQTSASLNEEKLKNWDGYNGEINEYLVKTMRFEDYFEEQLLLELDLIKIDVELHEPEVIAGMGVLIEKHKPIEFLEVLNSTIAEKLNHLIDLENFSLFHLTGINKFNETKIFKAHVEYWNYVLVPKNKLNIYPFSSFNFTE